MVSLIQRRLLSNPLFPRMGYVTESVIMSSALIPYETWL